MSNSETACDKSSSADAPESTQPAENVESHQSSDWPSAGVLATLIVVGIVAYQNSFTGAFVYDDLPAIRDNVGIRSLWPLTDAMSFPLINDGLTVSRRPMLSLSFALNRRVFGSQPWGFHLVNLAIHITAAVLLFMFIQRTLCLPQFRSQFETKSVNVALAIAVMWLVHPLQTESVTYIVQRAESLTGMLYLLTMVCALKGFNSPHQKRWFSAAVLSCAVGMGVKEVMITAPIMVFLYDGIFISPSFGAAWRERRRFYVMLFATWSICMGLQISGWKDVQADFTDRNPITYALTQPAVILYYLKLYVWPHPLVMDYNWPDSSGAAEIVPAGIVIAVLMGLSIWGVYHRRWFGFLGAWFFLILGPSSSFAALTQNLEEHRVYLSLAALICLLVFGFCSLRNGSKFELLRKHGGRIGTICVLAIVVTSISLTHLRNRKYESRYALWTDNLQYRPNSSQAHNNLGVVLDEGGDSNQARQHYETAIRILPRFATAHNNLGSVLFEQGQIQRARVHFEQAVSIQPKFAQALHNLGKVFLQLDDLVQAEKYLEQAVDANANNADAQYDLGVVLAYMNRPWAAITHFKRAVELDPGNGKAHNNIGSLLAHEGYLRQALTHFEQAVGIDPNNELATQGLIRTRRLLNEQ